MENNLTALEERIGCYFHNKKLLVQAVIHPTFAYEVLAKNLPDNQRLEFLGDSILGMVVAEYLYEKYPNFSERELSRRRTLLVNKSYLVKIAKEINLGQYLILGRGEEKIGGRNNPTNLSCALEAVIGAIYLDGGFEKVRKFIIEKIIRLDDGG